MNADVTIIIVTWNSREVLPACLASVPGGAGSVTCEITVVDNGSTDGTMAYLQGSHPGIRLLANTENRGFAAANNQALRLARGRYCLLLNPDTILQEGAIERLVSCLDEHPEALAAGPTVLNRDLSLQRTGVAFPSPGNILAEAFFLDRLFPRSTTFGGHRRLYTNPGELREVDYVQGSCLMVRSTVIALLGGLDEEYFMYFEETDWCFRMKKQGGKILVCPGASVVHLGGEPAVHYGERRLLYYHGGLLTFFRKHHTPGESIALRATLLLRSVLRICLWLGIAACRPSRRADGWSSVRGYARTIPLLVTESLR